MEETTKLVKLKETLAKQTFEQLKLEAIPDFWLNYLGEHQEVVKEAYLAYRGEESAYTHMALLEGKLLFSFSYADNQFRLQEGTSWEVTGSLEDFVTLMATLDMVYAPIYPLGSVVELDIRLFPEVLQEMFSEEPGALVLLTGRKLDLRAGYEGYTLDYTARLWPIGEALGSNQVRVSNLMIKRVVFEGYRDDEWEPQVAQALHDRQLGLLQRSSAFMSPAQAYAYYAIDEVEKDGEG